ncbi:MAG: hypothetical protein GX102_15030 [Porphyromonadaceae bacterium]|nr:hypothetical protein [Porphyromonadaceae bacterium]
MLNYFPKFFTNRAIALYFIALVAVTLVFLRNSMSMLWMVFGAVEVVGFFYISNLLTKKWSKYSAKTFQKRLIYSAVVLRLAWVVFSYFFYIHMNGEPYEFGSADSHAYNALGIEGATAFRTGNFNVLQIFGYLQVGDMGYASYLSVVYLLTRNSVFIARLLKVIWSAWTVVFVYKLATRNFGEGTGRIAAILTMLMPNLIYYCGLHVKETEMVFISLMFLERADYLLRSKSFNYVNVFVTLLLAFILFTFRTVLGAVAVFALISAVIFSSDRVVKWQKRILVGFWILLAVLVFAGGQIATEVEETWENRNINQQAGMEYRAQREGGNVFAKYGTRTLFAPTIFIIPIPSMVHVVGQENQQLIHGGNFVKNIMAFFLLFAFILFIKEKRWREFTLLEVFMLGYLMVIAFSNFAQSERFHLPTLPIYLMFSAYGISRVTNKTKNYFNWYLVGLFFIILAWNFIKLAGRGIA